MNDLHEIKTPADIDVECDGQRLVVDHRTRARVYHPEFKLKPRTPTWLERPGNPCSVDSDGAGYPESEDWGD